jgi:hypothetical protein
MSMERPQPVDPAERGLLTGHPDLLAQNVIEAWDLFVELVARTDLSGPTRSRKHSAREIAIPLGTWPDSPVLSRMREHARVRTTTVEPLQDEAERLVEAHDDASDEEIIAALALSRDHVSHWLRGSDSLEVEGYLPVPSPLGLLPLGTAIHSAVFRLAITARDMAPAGAQDSPQLTDLGLLALWDAAGAVAARIDLTARVAAVTDTILVGIDITPGGWQTTIGVNVDGEGPAVVGPAPLLVDMAGGRLHPTAVGRHLRLQQTKQVLELTPVLDEIPDLPGGPILRQAARLARFVGRA